MLTCLMATACAEVVDDGANDPVAVARQAVASGLGDDLAEGRSVYFRCNATGWAPSSATRLTPGDEPGTYVLNYEVTQAWMVESYDQCTITETDQVDGWGFEQRDLAVENSGILEAPVSATVEASGDAIFDVRYPETGSYTVTLSYPDQRVTIARAGDVVEPPCRGYLCLPPPADETIDEVITRCPSKEVLDAIDEDLDIRFEFGDEDGDGTLDDPSPMGDTLVCTAADGSRDLTLSQERLYQAIIAIRALSPRFTEPLAFTGGKGLYEWFRDATTGIRLRSDVNGSFCCTPPPEVEGGYLNIQNNAGRAFYVTDLWATTQGFGLQSLTQLLIHEARHADGKPHTCGSANDQTIDELGAWGTVYTLGRALAFDVDPCFLRPALPAPATYPGQLFAPDAYLAAGRDLAYRVQDQRFCAEPTTSPDVPEPVTACQE